MSVFFINSFLGAADGDFESIATITVGSGGASSITFSDIPSGFQHLQVRGLVRAAVSGTQNTRLTFNGTTAATYLHQLIGDGATAYTVTYTDAGNSIWFQSTIGSNGTANAFTGAVVDILDYASTSKTKVARTAFGWDGNGSGNCGITSILWNNTAAVTSITMANWGGNWAQHSTLALYGLRAP